MIELDRQEVWLDRRGRLWEWSDLNGWVVNGMAKFGGFWPSDDDLPFSPA